MTKSRPKQMADEFAIAGGNANEGHATVQGSPQTAPVAKNSKQRTGKKHGSIIEVRSGTRIMESFPLTERDMQSLLSSGRESNFYFGVGGTAFGFAINILTGINLSTGVPDGTTSLWKGIAIALALMAGFFGLMGLHKQSAGKVLFDEIKDQTKHDQA
jgi:hypothetical protein